MVKPVGRDSASTVSVMSSYGFLCCPGTAIADGRLFLSSPNESRPILLVLQMKSTTTDTSLTKPQLSTLYNKFKTHISPKYPNHRILFGLITNRIPNRFALSDLQSHEDIFLISQNEISQFCPLLAHRLHPSFLPQLTHV